MDATGSTGLPRCTEHGLAFLALEVLGQLDQLSPMVLNADQVMNSSPVDVERARQHQRPAPVPRFNMRIGRINCRPEVTNRDHREQRDRDRDEADVKHCGVPISLACRLLDDERPAERRHPRGYADSTSPLSPVYSPATGPGPWIGAQGATSGCSLMFLACATIAFRSGSPWAMSSPFDASTSA